MPLPERHALTESAFVQTFRNLTGVPSYHYDAVFGRIVHERFASTRPGVVALPKGLWSHHTENGATSNALSPDTLSDLGAGACFNDARVEVAPLRV